MAFARYLLNNVRGTAAPGGSGLRIGTLEPSGDPGIAWNAFPANTYPAPAAAEDPGSTRHSHNSVIDLFSPPGTAPAYPGGFYVIQGDDVFELSAPPDWALGHTIADASANVQGQAIHSGLYAVYGRSGTPYMCALAQGTALNRVTRLRKNLETGVYTSGQLGPADTANVDALGPAVVYRNRLWVPSSVGRSVWVYDPDQDTVELSRVHSDNGRPFAHLHVVAGRLILVCATSTGQRNLEIWEYLGGGWVRLTTLLTGNLEPLGFGGEATHGVTTLDDVQMIVLSQCFDTGTFARGLRGYTLTWTATPGAAPTINDWTSGIPIALPLSVGGAPLRFQSTATTFASMRIWCQVDGATNGQGAGIRIYVQPSPTPVGSTFVVCYAVGFGPVFAMFNVGGGGGWFDQSGIQFYAASEEYQYLASPKVHLLGNPVQEAGGLRVSFWLPNAPAPTPGQQVKLYHSRPDLGDDCAATRECTLAGPVTGGIATLNLVQNRVENCEADQTLVATVYSVLWDFAADGVPDTLRCRLRADLAP